jgi:hypothetical protein
LLTLNQNSTAEIEIPVSEKIIELNNSGPVDVQKSDLTSPGKIMSILKRLKNRNLVPKILPRMVLVYLTFVFNACMKIKYFPNSGDRLQLCLFPSLLRTFLTQQVIGLLVGNIQLARFLSV